MSSWHSPFSLSFFVLFSRYEFPSLIVPVYELPVFLRFFADLVNSFGSNSNDPDTMVRQVIKYAFYFLVVGAAIWASSWAGESFPNSLFSTIRIRELVLGMEQRYLAGCGPGSGRRPR
ncbi:hypothetical protein COCNU_contig69187441G000010 [Cocos nucifera]|nr:hypothetical protein [Cocos nucifera]